MDEPVVHFLSRQDGAFRVVVQPAGEAPACAAVIGEPEDDCLVRVHSRCLYSEAFGSEDCDCREQLSRSLELIRGEGAGVLVYLDQEGRGSGLVAKARGYVYSQATGADTYESYAALNLPADSRSYAAAADLFRHLGLSRVRLLTNNPDKVAALEAAGLVVKQEPLHVPVGEKAAAYLEAKRARGHARPPGGTGSA